MRINVLILFILMMLLSAASQAADLKDSVMQDGNNRDFYIHVPDKGAGRKWPVVIVMHGGGGNALQVSGQTGMNAVADRHGFMVVYPEGSSGPLLSKVRTWNAGRCCGKSVQDNIDDVGFISMVIDKLVAKYDVDPARVYATGHSNGAMMSYRLACELSDKIAAIAPNAGQRTFDDCHPSRPVPVLHIHGTADPCALYNGGPSCGGCFTKALGIHLKNENWSCAPVRDIVAEQAQINGCSQQKKVVFTKGAVTCESYLGCPADGAVALCSIEGEGHAWAGATDVGPPGCRENPDKFACRRYLEAIGPVNHDMNAGELMWDFFKNFHR